MCVLTHRTEILPVVLYGCETRSPHWGRNIVWGCSRIGCWGSYQGLGGNGEDYIPRSFVVCNIHEGQRWIFRVIKSRRMRWTGHVARIGESTGAYRLRLEKSEDYYHSEDVGWDLNIILKRIFKTWGGGHTDWIDLDQNRNRWRDFVNAVLNT